MGREPEKTVTRMKNDGKYGANTRDKVSPSECTICEFIEEATRLSTSDLVPGDGNILMQADICVPF